jgi:hypothetical protein
MNVPILCRIIQNRRLDIKPRSDMVSSMVSFDCDNRVQDCHRCVRGFFGALRSGECEVLQVVA